MIGLDFSQAVITSITLVTIVSQVSTELYYIEPIDTPSVCENGGNCMSLAQFAGHYVASDNNDTLTLVFLPGEHTLSRIIQISNIHNVSLIGDITKLTVINFSGASGFELVNISAVLFVTHLKMKSNGQTVLSIDNVESVFIKQCRICGQKELQLSAAVVIYSALNVSISESDFEVLYMARASSLLNAVGGSALLIHNTSIVFVEASSFSNNLVQGVSTLNVAGGAILLKTIELATLVNCTLKNNTVLCYGCQYANGGAISLESVYQFTVTNSIFEGNRIVFSNDNFENVFGGGAIHVGNTSIVKISANTFINNFSDLGGSVFVHDQMCLFYSSNNAYIYNSACRGGAILSTSHTLTHNDYYEGNKAVLGGGAVMVLASNFTSINSFFIRNTNLLENGGGAILILFRENGKCDISRNFFVSNTASYGAAIQANLDKSRCSYQSFSNQFISNNSSMNGGAVYILANGSSTYNSSHNQFIGNAAKQGGGGLMFVIIINDGEYISYSNAFQNNSAHSGGAVMIQYNSTKLKRNGSFSSLHNSFINNLATYGGAVNIESRNIEESATNFITNDLYLSNTAQTEGGALRVLAQITLLIEKSNFFRNCISRQLPAGGALTFRNSVIRVYDSTVFSTEGTESSILVYDSYFLGKDFRVAKNTGSLKAINSVLEFEGKCEFMHNGGAIWASRSSIQFKSPGTVEIKGNDATNGGGIFLVESQLNISSSVYMSGNMALQTGGGIYAYRSKVSYKSRENTMTINNNAAQNGGGLALVSSTLDVHQSVVVFQNNTAYQGGGAAYLEQRSTLYLHVTKYLTTTYQHIFGSILVLHNFAQYGGGFFIDDYSSGHTLCQHNMDSTNPSGVTECFMQGLTFISKLNFNKTVVSFTNNTAQMKGNDIYGGLLDRCTVNPDAYTLHKISGLQYIRTLAKFNKKDGSSLSKHDVAQHITSSPIQLCFCNYNNTYDCTVIQKSLLVKRGGPFKLMVTAVDQVQYQVPGTVIASLSDYDGHFKEEQARQPLTDSACTKLEYNVFSDRPKVIVDIYADGPCEDEGFSKRTVEVEFLPCTCNIGFQPSESSQECDCECIEEIKAIASCSDNATITLLPQSNEWVGSVNGSTELLLHLCPFDYCLERPVNISLSDPNGVDMQCAFNRSNLLCGECKQGLSLMLGSSKCMECTNKYLALLLLFAILGILLVTLILTLNMTIAVGTINGLIFYTNIVGAGQPIFYSKKEFVLKYFIAWLNLDFGVEACFYDHMSSNAKVLLQLVFPSYVILLTIVIIVLCECSQKFATLVGKRNPVATLCTLIFLSYSKLLRMIISSLQFTYVSYSNHSEIVWLYDANVPYFEPSKSTARFLISSIIIIFGALYTALLFFGQWLPRLANRRMMKWIRHPKYNAFIDAYHAPFSPNHRYWVGLLLLARIVHHLAQALTDNELIILLTTSCISLGLLTLKTVNTRTYKNWTLDMLENTFIINLTLLSVATLYVKGSNGNQPALLTTSALISIIIFLCILCHHLCKYVLKSTTCFNTTTGRLGRRRHNDYELAPIIDAREFDEQDLLAEDLQETANDHPGKSEEGEADALNTDPGQNMDQLREPDLDILDPVTAGHYREAFRRRQPNPPPREPTTQFIDKPKTLIT